MSNRFPPIVLSDGSKCYSGPDCRRHGGQSSSAPVSLLESIEAKLGVARREAGSVFPTGRTRVGLNGSDPEWALGFYELAEGVKETIPKDVYNAVRTYQMTSAGDMNRLLRGGVDAIRNRLAYVYGDKLTDENVADEVEHLERYTARMDEVFEHEVVFDEPLIVYRAASFTHGGTGSVLENVKEHFKPGDEFVEDAFVSTSLDSDYMSFYGRSRVKKKGPQVVFEVVARRGLPLTPLRVTRPGAPLTSVPTPGSIQSFEREVLLNRGSKFRVVGVKNVTFEHSYPKELLANSMHTGGLPKKATFPVVQVEQVI